MPSKRAFQKPTKDVYTRITERIVRDLEQGVRPWVKPWSAENAAGKIMRPLRHNGLPYSGINVLMLWSEAAEQGFASPTWMTYRQAQELGAQVRKGEKGSLVVYANTITVKEENDDGQEDAREIGFLKGYTVFNCDQVDGLPEHEASHWTRHPSRLDRSLGRKRWGDEGYAREELCAELSAAFLCADLALTPETRDDHAAYIASWLEVLKNDKRAIFEAASHAQRAADFLHGLQKEAIQ